MSLPSEFLDLASRQHNAIGRRQATDFITGRAYDGLLRRGRLLRLEHGVAAIAGGAQPPEQRLMAATLRAGDGARITGPAVLGLFDVDGFSPRDPFTVLVPEGRQVTEVTFPVAVDPLPKVDRARFDEIPIARLPMAFLEAASMVEELGERRLRVGLDSCCWKNLTTRDAIVDRAIQLPPEHPGAQWVLDLECGGGLRAESEQERKVFGVLEFVHPQPERQVPLTPRIRPDFLWRHLRLVGEYLGWVDHPVDDEGDQRRFEAIRALDHDIIVIRAADLKDPDALAARVQLRLVQRARELGVQLA